MSSGTTKVPDKGSWSEEGGNAGMGVESPSVAESTSVAFSLRLLVNERMDALCARRRLNAATGEDKLLGRGSFRKLDFEQSTVGPKEEAGWVGVGVSERDDDAVNKEVCVCESVNDAARSETATMGALSPRSSSDMPVPRAGRALTSSKTQAFACVGCCSE